MRKSFEKRMAILKRIFNRRAGQLARPRSLDLAAQFFEVDLSDRHHRELLLFALAEACSERVGLGSGAIASSGTARD
jgi:hypothetical protein